MRTLLEIIESAKDGNRPDYDECYYAVLVLSYLHGFDWQDLLVVGGGVGVSMLKSRAAESFKRSKKAMSVSPKEYLGWGYDPANPEYQKQRALLANKIFKKIEEGK